MTIAVVTTIVTTVLGVIFAIALHRYKYRYEGAINGLVYLPILIPDILMGLSLLILFSQLGMELGKTTIIIAHITFSISFVVVILAARLSGMGRDLEEAANDHRSNAVANVSLCNVPSNCTRSYFSRIINIHIIN